MKKSLFIAGAASLLISGYAVAYGYYYGNQGTRADYYGQPSNRPISGRPFYSRDRQVRDQPNVRIYFSEREDSQFGDDDYSQQRYGADRGFGSAGNPDTRNGRNGKGLILEEDDFETKGDKQLVIHIRRALLQEGTIRNLDNISIAVDNGDVTVSGYVQNQSEKDRLLRLVRSFRAVKNVEDDLSVDSDRANQKGSNRSWWSWGGRDQEDRDARSDRDSRNGSRRDRDFSRGQNRNNQNGNNWWNWNGNNRDRSNGNGSHDEDDSQDDSWFNWGNGKGSRNGNGNQKNYPGSQRMNRGAFSYSSHGNGHDNGDDNDHDDDEEYDDDNGYNGQQNGNRIQSARDRLTQRIKQALSNDPSISAYNIRVINSDGDVILRGFVVSERDKQGAERKVRGIIGVKSVDNQLEVRREAAQQQQQSRRTSNY